ncbi:galactokinase [Paenibacillus shirakamiensis]|uniref:Galactokinase n=1 Tax=Paenibacillus shirakamiensis TaxID=1265935 RepID=A0ABS4JBF5_9BACL|nr:galactokinase [Paenibacillus shirakamiensis]MBP1999047.1 galactokinase [Paenibacillus shirakamiensis]
MNLKEMKQQFANYYGEHQEQVYSFQAPGRVNLIGEHIDYNGGYVLPAALEFGTTLLVRRRKDSLISFKSHHYEYTSVLPLEEVAQGKIDQWIDYPSGVIHELEQLGVKLTCGYDLMYFGEIPNGAGLSSSASIEVVTAYALSQMEKATIDKVEIAKLSQRAENKYVGVNSGIMDQFASANGAKDHAILLMCGTLEYKLVPFEAGDYKLVIGNTNKRRGLVDSKYNERRSECDEALRRIHTLMPELKHLAGLTPEQFEQVKGTLQDDILEKRAQHVVQENARVLSSVDALSQGELQRFGQYMNASHDSLRDLYEVSCRELDVMVEEARRIEGTLGSRMTGAGFGGCTVSLVHKDSVEQFVDQVGTAYQERTELQGEFYVCSVGQGVSELKEEN